MAEHLYLAVTCRTPGCTAACVVKYLGPYVGQTEITELVPTMFEFECGDCHRTHRYFRADVYPVKTEMAPPPGFRNGF